MPRINIEDSLFCDDRFMRLVELTGERVTAIGSLVLAFKLAQKHWIPNKNLIPKEEFGMIPNWGHLLNCNLAKETPEGFYVKGTESCTEWWFKAKEKGRKGGIAKALNFGKNNVAQAATAIPQACLSLPSSSSSSSSSLTTTKEIQKFEEIWELVPKEFTEAIGSIYKQFNQTVPRDVRKNYVKIKNHFESRESFANWSNEIFELNKGARQYTVALLKEVGAFQ